MQTDPRDRRADLQLCASATPCCARSAATTRSRPASNSWPRRSGWAVYPFGSTPAAERELAERLEVSRATLREAMAALRAAGLVETRRGRGGGTVVTMKPQGPSARTVDRTTAAQRADWLDALDFRRIVEPGAAALAASRRPRRRTRATAGRAAHAAVAKAPAAGPAHRQADSRFHLTIATLSGLAADRRVGHLGPGEPARDAERDPGAADQHRRTPTRQHAALVRADSRRATRAGPTRSWKSTATTRPRSCAAARMSDARRRTHAAPTTAT